MTDKTGGPAFPEVVTDEKWSDLHENFKRDIYTVGGMTLRDYFAAKAMQGIIACTPEKMPAPPDQITAERAYRYADAMLSERAK